MAPTPQLQHVYDAVVDIAPRRDLGRCRTGERFIVDILGGSFEGAALKGRVLAGGADRQLLRVDGVKELDALYEMKTHDGAVITVRNRVLVDDSRPEGRYARSVLQFTAPDGPYAWLGRRVFVGTLKSLRPDRSAVLVSAYMLA